MELMEKLEDTEPRQNSLGMFSEIVSENSNDDLLEFSNDRRRSCPNKPL